LVGIFPVSIQQALPRNKYWSHERILGEPCGLSDDIWAIGLIFLELYLHLQRSDCDTIQIGNCDVETESLVSCPPLSRVISMCLTTPASARPTAPTLLQLLQDQCIPESVLSRQPRHPVYVGAGDVVVIENFLDAALADAALKLLQSETHWYLLKHTAVSASPRLTGFQADIEDDGTVPVYRCADPQPWDNLYRTAPFSPTIQAIRERIEERTGYSFNWCRLLQYPSGKDDMAFHSDKCLDMRAGSPVVTLSLGQDRDYILRPKLSEEKDHIGTELGSQRLILRHNSLLILGPQTNMRFQHSVCKAPPGGEVLRLSLTFRDIATYYCPLYSNPECCLFGQGVPAIPNKVALVRSNRKELVRTLGRTLTTAASGGLVSVLMQRTISKLVSSLTSFCFGAVCSTICYRYLHVRAAERRAREMKGRYSRIFRLLNVMVIDPIGAIRLLYSASDLEIDGLVKAQTKRRHTEDTGTDAVAAPAPIPTLQAMQAPTPTSTSTLHVSFATEKRIRPAISRSPPPIRPTLSNISVCIFVDPINDYLQPSGVFAQTFGLEDTGYIRSMKVTFSELYSACQQKGIFVVLVSSTYTPLHISHIPGLCSSSTGRAFCIPALPSPPPSSKTLVIHKTSVSVLECSALEKQELLNRVAGKEVVVCGVTTVTGVQRAVDSLKDICRRIVVPRNAVASRAHSREKERGLLESWSSASFPNVEVIDTWESLFN
jgi:alkylated DNA repair dioxygenase AlkB/nicotinamidase-related amidase